MKIVIVGCGQIGLAIIKSLLNEKHDVLAIDSNPAVVEHVINSLDVMGICDKGVTYTKLKEAGVDKADIFIAMTDSDEINMETCSVAKAMGARHTIARIRGNEYNEPGKPCVHKRTLPHFYGHKPRKIDGGSGL